MSWCDFYFPLDSYSDSWTHKISLNKHFTRRVKLEIYEILHVFPTQFYCFVGEPFLGQTKTSISFECEFSKAPEFTF